MRLANKTAFITGGSSGIGLATARIFLAEGARVAITGRNRKSLDEAVAALGSGVIAFQADVTDVPAMERAAAEAAKTLGKLDIVFANAGIVARTPLGETSLELFEEVLRTNLTGAFFTVQAAFPHLNERASIILNGSVHAVLGIPASAAYAAAKGGVRTMVRNLASDLAPRGIRVNQVTPGATRTPIWSSAAPTEEARVALEAQISRMIPMGHLAEADDIAKAALYLASDDSIYVTGTEIVVDGGATGLPSGAPAYRPA